MAAQQSRHKGVTPAITWASPTPSEIAANDALIDELKKQNNFESSEETQRRKQTLESIQNITIEFVKVVSKKKKEKAIEDKKKGQSPKEGEEEYDLIDIDKAGGRIFTYGSYRLGVYGPGSDIDTLVVAPQHVCREDFFEHFPPLLEKMAPPGAIEEMTLVPDAYVPIIKLEFSSISIDLIFASLKIPSVPLGLDLKDIRLLKDLDDRGLRSINGTRVTDEILESVPQPKTFRTALRAVKLWAQRRAIYANVMGFPGGVAWAMLVARVCQLYPQATGSVVVGKFFRIIGKWSWPQPVLLKEIESGPPSKKIRIWNPKIYVGDRFHLMPIITPAYPSMCATHNITKSTQKIIIKELERGGDIVDKIFTGQLSWKNLFDRHTFFTEDYKYYLSIVSGSYSKDAQVIWSGLVESKVRHLVVDLEQNEAVDLAHPFNKGFERVHRCKNQDDVEATITGDLSCQVTDIKTETTDQANDPKHTAAANGEADNIAVVDHNRNGSSGVGTTMLYTTTYYIGIKLDTASKSLDISDHTDALRKRCTDWQNYNPEANFLTVVHTRNYDLPADVFNPGEVKPVRANKRKAAKKTEPTVKKRTASEMEGSATPQIEGKRRTSGNGNSSPKDK